MMSQAITTTTRRDLLAGSVAISAGMVGAAIAASPAQGADADMVILDLWNRRDEVFAQIRGIDAERKAAQERMPWWAQPGFDSINCDGELCGDISDDPAFAVLPKPPEGRGIYRKIRIGEAWIERAYQSNVHLHGEARAAAHRGRQLAELAERRKAMWAEWDRYGVRTLREREQEAVERLCDIYEEVGEAIAAAPAGSSVATAAAILTLMRNTMQAEDTLNTVDLVPLLGILQATRACLSGGLAADVDDVLNHDDRLIAELRFYESGAEA